VDDRGTALAVLTALPSIRAERDLRAHLEREYRPGRETRAGSP